MKQITRNSLFSLWFMFSANSLAGVQDIDNCFPKRALASAQSAYAEFINIKDSTDPFEIKYMQINLLDKVQLNQLSDYLKEILNSKNDEALKTKMVSLFDFNKDSYKSINRAIELIEDLLKKEAFSDRDPQLLTLKNILNALSNLPKQRIEADTSLFGLLASANDYYSGVKIELKNNLKKEQLLPKIKIDVKELLRDPIDLSQVVCDYSGPKNGYGYKPGLKISCNGKKYKLKFGPEFKSGPFNSRVMRSLGYITPKIDYVSSVEMNYDRKFILEFNSRKTTTKFVSVFGKKKVIVGNNDKKNPFGFIRALRLKSGELLEGDKLNLFTSSLYNHENLDINSELEKNIKTIIFTEGSISENDKDLIEVGPWRFEEEEHFNNLELRQGLIFFAWLGNSDFPMNNNALVINKNDNGTESVTPIYKDVGFGLGASHTSKLTSSKVNEMADYMSEKNYSSYDDSIISSSSNTATLVLLPKTPNKMLKDLKYIDIANAAQNICQFKKDSLKVALLNSGLNDSEAQMAMSKLSSRRLRLLKDFELKSIIENCDN